VGARQLQKDVLQVVVLDSNEPLAAIGRLPYCVALENGCGKLYKMGTMHSQALVLLFARTLPGLAFAAALQSLDLAVLIPLCAADHSDQVLRCMASVRRKSTASIDASLDVSMHLPVMLCL
jgi:hypothetical protein